jgi:pimeloyl-ACP methyl ester carboxylesterase
VTPPTAPVRETVASSDGVEVVVHHLGHGPKASPLLIAHATGFHGRAYSQLGAALSERHDVWGQDVRGHGVTAVPSRWAVDWHGYGDDATAAALWLSAFADGAQLVGFGHSLGGALLLMAADRHPGLFRTIVLYEPIVFPPSDEPFDPGQSPLARGALRRRRVFDSYRHAIENFASKPPMNAFDRAALEDYVYGGFRPVDPDVPDGPVELTCTPEHESATFAASHHAGLWERLSHIETPTVVLGGRREPTNPPSMMAEPVATQLAAGRYVETALDHFGPFIHPVVVAGLVETT